MRPKGVGIASDKRWPALPDILTSAEDGLPEFKIESWLGLYAPKGLPPPVLAKLRDALAKTLDDPEIQKKFTDIGGWVPKPEDRGGERMLEIIKDDVARIADIVKKAGGIEPPAEEKKPEEKK